MKAAAVAPAKPQTEPQLAAMVDELGALECQMAPYKTKLARIEALRRAIRGRYDALDAETSFTAAGAEYYSIIGPRANERSISDMAKLYKAVGRADFLGRCSFALRHLDELGIGASLVVIRPTGPRTLSVLRKAE